MKDTSKKGTPKRTAHRPGFWRRVERKARENKFLASILAPLIVAVLIALVVEGVPWAVKWNQHRLEVAERRNSPDTIIAFRPALPGRPAAMLVVPSGEIKIRPIKTTP